MPWAVDVDLIVEKLVDKSRNKPYTWIRIFKYICFSTIAITVIFSLSNRQFGNEIETKKLNFIFRTRNDSCVNMLLTKQKTEIQIDVTLL